MLLRDEIAFSTIEILCFKSLFTAKIHLKIFLFISLTVIIFILF